MVDFRSRPELLDQMAALPVLFGLDDNFKSWRLTYPAGDWLSPLDLEHLSKREFWFFNSQWDGTPQERWIVSTYPSNPAPFDLIKIKIVWGNGYQVARHLGMKISERFFKKLVIVVTSAEAATRDELKTYRRSIKTDYKRYYSYLQL